MNNDELHVAIAAVGIALVPPLLVSIAAFIAPRRWERIAQVASAIPILIYVVFVGAVLFYGSNGDQNDNAAGASAAIFLPVLGIWLGLIWGAAYGVAWLRGVRPGRAQPLRDEDDALH